MNMMPRVGNVDLGARLPYSTTPMRYVIDIGDIGINLKRQLNTLLPDGPNHTEQVSNIMLDLFTEVVAVFDSDSNEYFLSIASTEVLEIIFQKWGMAPQAYREQLYAFYKELAVRLYPTILRTVNGRVCSCFIDNIGLDYMVFVADYDQPY